MIPMRVFAPSPPDEGPCRACGHSAGEHWMGEPGGCEAPSGCTCIYYPNRRADQNQPEGDS